MDSAIAGIDIGATSVKVGVVDADGKVLGRKYSAYDLVGREPEAIVRLACQTLQVVLEELQIKLIELQGVGVGCPGVLTSDGVVRAASNFTTWKDVPLLQLFHAELLAVKVVLCNDADAAILAEHWIGSARNDVHTFVIHIHQALGTGVGSGLIANGQIVQGASHNVEGGHMIVEKNGRLCGCKQQGCLEMYSSASAVVTQAKERLSQYPTSSLRQYASTDINSKLIVQLARQGDSLCQSVLEEAADYLGFACVNYARILDPQLIILAGGLAEAGDILFDLVREAYQKYTSPLISTRLEIAPASAGYESGVVGAAAMARQQIKSEE